MENYSVWDLIKTGRFDDACKKADIEYEQTKSIFILRNKVLALLHLKKYQECIQLSKDIIESNKGDTDSDFIFSGIAFWGMGQKENAFKIWLMAENCKYTDALGGILLNIILFFASIKLQNIELKNKVIKRINKLLKSKMAINFPGPLGNFLIGNISFADIDNLINKSAQPLQDRLKCQAYFVLALSCLEHGSNYEYYENLKKCINQNNTSYLEFEYYISKIEIENSMFQPK